MSEIHLDVSDLPAPEPLQKILQNTNSLPLGSVLHVTHRMKPHLLFGELDSSGFVYNMKTDRQAVVHIWIWRTGDSQAESLAAQSAGRV